MKKNHWSIHFFLLAGLILYVPMSYAQGTLRERIQARRLEKKQAAGEAKVQAYGRPGDHEFSIMLDKKPKFI